MPRLHSAAPPAGTAPVARLTGIRDFEQLRVRSYSAGDSVLTADGNSHDRPLLLIWLRGGGEVRQRGRSLIAGAGSLCFLPHDATVWLRGVGPEGAIVLELPVEVEARARERVAAAIGTVITAPNGAAAFLRSFLDTLEHQPLSYRPDYPGWVQMCICEITDRVLAECVDSQPTPAERAVLAAKHYALAHLSDPELSPHRIAREAAVSLRTLNRLFAADDDSVCGWIRRRRLERCRDDLLNPGRLDWAISQIGAFWGFPDAAHFSRAFKDAYGCSPRAFRAAAGAARGETTGVDRVA